MRKIYKLCIGIALSAIIVACADKLDSDKYFKDRTSRPLVSLSMRFTGRKTGLLP